MAPIQDDNVESHSTSSDSEKVTDHTSPQAPVAGGPTDQSSPPNLSTDNSSPATNGATPAVEQDAEKKNANRFDKTFEEKEGPKHALVDMSTIELTAEDLYDKDKVDLEQVGLDDIWTLLQ